MKNLIKKLLREGLLNEGASPILYHFTWINRLENILDTNTLFLTPVTSTAEKTKGKNYFMSFTRTKTTKQGYGNKFGRKGGVRLKIDGTKLGHNYKVMPIDYWQYPRTPELMKQGSGDEMEDRVVSDKDEITNANKYIISIDVFVDGEVNSSIIKKAEALGIKINFYDNERDFESANPSKAISPNTKDDGGGGGKKEEHRMYNIIEIVAALTYKVPNSLEQILNDFETKFDGGGFSDKLRSGVKERQSKYDYYLRPNDDYYLTDISNTLSSTLHNNKTSPNTFIRYLMRLFLSDLKKSGSKSAKEYLKHKIFVGKKTQEDFNKEFNSGAMKVINSTYKENIGDFNYSVYNDTESWENLYMYEPAKQFLDSKVEEIKKYVSNYIINNDDMFKYYYKLSNRDIIEELGLEDSNPEVIKIANSLQDFHPNELVRPLQMVAYAIGEFSSDEATRLQQENMDQWNN